MTINNTFAALVFFFTFFLYVTPRFKLGLNIVTILVLNILQDVGDRTRTCVFYNFTLNNMAGGWSSAGCTYDGQVNGRDVCLCDHMTNFAVLVVSVM